MSEGERNMELFFAPLACSMATRIALYEAGADDARFHPVDLKAKRLEDGTSFLAINPLGQVPALRLPSGDVLTENPAVLQCVADAYPGAGLAPNDGTGRHQVQRWLSFIGSELHKAVFTPLLDAASPDGAKEYARKKADAPFFYLAQHLDRREYLLDRFSVADAYLATVLNWTAVTDLRLAGWPAVQAYHHRVLTRPAAARAFAEERAMYAEEQARRTAR